MNRSRARLLQAAAAATALVLLAAACGGDDDGGGDDETTTVAVGATTTAASTATTAGGQLIDADRCATNQAVGTITYASSFDFAAAASIVDVVVAENKGYFDAMCLDVELVPGFSTSNYPLIAAGQAQFSSAGNYTEILNNTTGDAQFLALVDYGKAPIEALVTPDAGATTLEELEGKRVGVKGDLPPSLVALLASHGLARGTDYTEISLQGFDPIAHLESGIDALPVYKSNEPGQLDAAGIAYHLFDPAAEGIPGSFGILYTSQEFADTNPTVVEDFTRAALKGMEDAIADIPGAVEIAVQQIEGAGNQAFLTLEGETYRWEQESKAVLDSTPAGEPVGLIDPDLLRAEYDAYVEAGVWPEGAPDYGEYFDTEVASAAYDADGKVIWGS